MKKLAIFLLFAALPLSATKRFIAPSGVNTGTCVSQGSPCLDLNYAYSTVSVAGDEIEGANGTYTGNMSIINPPSKPGAGVFIHAVAGGVMTVNGGWGINGSANVIEVDDLTATGVSEIDSSNVTMRRVRALNGTGSAGWFLQNAHDSSFFQCEIGFQDPGDGLKFFVSANGVNSNILFDGLVEHDLTFFNDPTAHQDGVETEAINGLTVRNSKFWNTSTQGIYFICDLPNCGVSNVTYENNWFGPAQNGTNAMNLRVGTNVTFRYNTYTSAAFASGVTNLQIIGNIFDGFNFGSGDFSCQTLAGASTTFQYNVVQYPSGSTCGDSTNKRFLDGSVNSHLVNPVSATLAAWDLHLLAGSPAIDAGSPTIFPATDIDGQTRPVGALADSGSDEFGTFSALPVSIPFGNVNLGATSSNQVVTYTNTSSTTVNLVGTTIIGTNPGDFNRANLCGGQLVQNGTCTNNVTCTPSQAGLRTATLRMQDDAPGNPHDVALSCTGISNVSDATISPPSPLAFGNVSTGQTSTLTLTLTNNGGATLTITSILLGGGTDASYTFSTSCGSTLVSLASCSIFVTFAPVSTGAKSGSIVFTDNAASSPQTINLTGTGVTPPVVVWKSYVDSQGGSGAATTVTASSNLNLASGDTVACILGWSGTSVVPTSVFIGSDAMTFVKGATGTPGTLYTYVKFGTTVNAAASAVATWPSAVSSRQIACASYSGLSTGSVDKTSCNSAGCNVETTGTAGRTVQNVTTTSANELLFYGDWDNGSSTRSAASGWNLRTGSGTPGTRDYQLSDLIVSSTGTYPAGDVNSAGVSNYISTIATFKTSSITISRSIGGSHKLGGGRTVR